MRSANIVVVAAVGLGLSACSAAEEIASFDIAGGTLSAIGVTSPNREAPQDPQPRGPLVVPGSTDLPQPREAVATNDPAWPKNAEEATEEFEAERKRIGSEYTARMDRDDVVLSPDELAGVRGPTPNSGRAADELQLSRTEGVSATLSAAERRRQSDAALELAAQQAGQDKSERRYLIDPPSEYRQLSGVDYEGKDELLEGAAKKEEKKGLGRLWPF